MKSLRIFVIMGLMLLVGFSAQAFDRSIMQDSSIVLHGVDYPYPNEWPIKSYERCVVENDTIWDYELSLSGNVLNFRYYTIMPDSLRNFDFWCSDGSNNHRLRVFPLINPERWSKDITSYVATYDSISPFVYKVNITVATDAFKFEDYFNLSNLVVNVFIQTLFSSRGYRTEFEYRNSSSGFMDIPQDDNVRYVRYYALNGMELQQIPIGTPVICHMYGEGDRLLKKCVVVQK